jgi:predicted phage terminase large subunit-like protein
MMNRDRDLLDAILRTDLQAFARQSFTTLNPGTNFLPNWHIDAICHHLELVRNGRIQRLIINLPPRSLKSSICSAAFPAFVLGHDPTARIIAVSYGSELAVKLANDCRAVLQSSWYRRLFPQTRVSSTKNTEIEIATTRHGHRLAASVGGSLTGRGGNFIIVDDPIKPQDAYSDSKRESVNDWYDNTLLSRLDDKRTGAIIVVTQRLHPDDLTGKLLRGADDWTVLSLPAIAEDGQQIPIGESRYHHRKAGDLLHPEREPLRVLNNIRSQIGSEKFSAQYQQSPVAPGGNMIKRDWICRYETLPTQPSSTYTLQSYDTASKPGEQNDWTVCTTWHIVGARYYLIDVLRRRLDYPTLRARAKEHARTLQPSIILVEDSGLGCALVSDLQAEQFNAVAVKVEYDKKTRMAIQSAVFENGHVYFPYQAPWLQELETELFAFPGSRYDDQVDSISQALAHKINASSIWSKKSVEGLENFTEAIALDQCWGLLMGRPW